MEDRAGLWAPMFGWRKRESFVRGSLRLRRGAQRV